jgi:16S rRNA (uracil1498-N3)-methyltransferase
MPISRVFQNSTLVEGASLALDTNASHHLSRVLRASIGDKLIIFNGLGGEFTATITQIDKKAVHVLISTFNAREAESSLDLWLAQGISRGEKMDYTIQKAVELGVKKIIPLFTERCTVKLDQERLNKRLEHWQAIARSSAEQSGRNRIPDILTPTTLENALPFMQTQWRFVLSPHVTQKLHTIQIDKLQPVLLLIGPEGGLSEQEMIFTKSHDFLPLNLGPRVMRTETAAVAAITALQCYFGDMG